MKLYLISGLPASGKTTFCKIAEEMGYPVVSMGGMSKNLYERLYVDGFTMSEFANMMRMNLSQDYCAALTTYHIKHHEMNSDVIFVDGVRSQHEVNFFKKHFDVMVIKIKSNYIFRRNRFVIRKNRSNIIEYFDKRNDDEVRWGYSNINVDKFINNAYSLVNFKIAVKIYIEMEMNKTPSHEKDLKKLMESIDEFFESNPTFFELFKRLER